MVLFKRGSGLLHVFRSVVVPLNLVDGDQLYTGVKQLVAEHLDSLAEERIVPAFPRSSGTHGAGKLGGGAEAVERAMEGDRFLKAVKGVWEDHTGSMRKLKDVLRYMVSRHTKLSLTFRTRSTPPRRAYLRSTKSA
jgi:hypothetical protein